jgi:HK97 family phage major capsid protein
LQKQFDDLLSAKTKIENTATSANRDLTDSENADIDGLLSRAEQLKPEIEQLAQREQSLQATADILARVNGGTPTSINRAVAAASEGRELSAGEFFAAYFQAYHPQGASAPEEFLDRAARYIDRAVMASADAAGILPTPIVGNVIKFADSRRPVFNSMAHPSMPDKGKTFERPRVTQRVTVGEQASEGDTLSTQKMTLTSDTVTKQTFGGYLDLTAQDIDWTEPSALQLVITDFADVYAEVTEGEACDFLESLIVAGDTAVDGSTYSTYTTTNIGTIVTSYVNAVQNVYARAKRFPDTVWLDLASWATLVGTTNANNDTTAMDLLKRALSDLGADGMRWVVGPQLAANTRILGVSSLVEAYEQQKGLLRAELPSALKVQIAYAGYVAFWGRYEGFVQLGTDPD